MIVRVLLVVAFLAPVAWAGDKFSDLDGADRIRDVQKLARQFGRGGRVSDVRFGEDGVFFLADNWKVVDLETGEIREADADNLPPRARRRGRGEGRRPGQRPARGRQRTEEFSPEAGMTAVHKGYNIVLRNEAGQEIPVTTDGDEKLRFGTASWVYGEELDQTDAMWWSPDGSKLAFYAFDVSPTRDYYLIDGLGSLRTEVMRERYPKAGDPNPIAGLRILDLASGAITTVDVGPEDDQYIYSVRWTPDGSELLFHRTNRHQNHLEILAVDPTTGNTRLVVEERQDTWQRNRPEMRFLEDGQRFIWETERTGWKHWQLRDLDGSLVADLTTGEYPVQSIVKVDEDAGRLYYTAASSETPINPQLHRVNLDGTDPRRYTSADLHHSDFRLSEDGRFVVCTRQAVDVPPSTVLYDEDGREIAVLAEGDISGMEAAGLQGGKLVRFTAADGETPLHAVLHVPANFDPSRKYPLLVDVYGGPESRGPRNTFTVANPYCELGFAIAKIENRGTIGRSKAFEGATYLKLGGPDLDDQVAGIKAMLEAYPWLDGDRVGMTGHSYGGYMAALAMVRYPEVFHAAVAGAPVTDFRNYDTIYTERYMRTPDENRAGYNAGSAVRQAKKLKGHLLLVHGMVDDNVHPSNTFQMAEVLQGADIPFEMQLFARSGHGIGSPAYRSSKWSFLQEHLVDADESP